MKNADYITASLCLIPLLFFSCFSRIEGSNDTSKEKLSIKSVHVVETRNDSFDLRGVDKKIYKSPSDILVAFGSGERIGIREFSSLQKYADKLPSSSYRLDGPNLSEVYINFDEISAESKAKMTKPTDIVNGELKDIETAYSSVRLATGSLFCAPLIVLEDVRFFGNEEKSYVGGYTIISVLDGENRSEFIVKEARDVYCTSTGTLAYSTGSAWGEGGEFTTPTGLVFFEISENDSVKTKSILEFKHSTTFSQRHADLLAISKLENSARRAIIFTGYESSVLQANLSVSQYVKWLNQRGDESLTDKSLLKDFLVEIEFDDVQSIIR